MTNHQAVLIAQVVECTLGQTWEKSDPTTINVKSAERL
jgi:hypothetical protein